jgi:hypothetical protein
MELPAGLGEGQIAGFFGNDEVKARQVVGHATLFATADFGLQPDHEIDDIEEAPAGPIADKRLRNGDGEMAPSGRVSDLLCIGDLVHAS